MSTLSSMDHNLSSNSITENLLNALQNDTALTSAPQLSSPNQLVVIDSGVDSYVQLAEALIAESTVLVLDAAIDGISQIDSFIHQFQEISALHIVSHGDAGKIQLGSTQLDAASLPHYQNALAGWNTVLTDTADVLLYGCNVADGNAGNAFLEKLHNITGADIAASNDLTGSYSLGGDWDLEAQFGLIETEQAFSLPQVALYDSVLSSLPVTDGLVFHLDADLGVTTDASNIVTDWTEQSGTNNILSAFGDPLLIANRLNGNSVIKLDAVDDRLQVTSGLEGLPDGSEDRTIFFVTKYDGDSNGTGGVSYGSASGNNTFGLVSINENLGIHGWQAANDFRSTERARKEGWLLQSAVLSSDTLSHYRDGLLIDTQNHVYDTTLEQLIIGAEIDGTPSTGLEVAEVLIYDRALSKNERQSVENALTTEYALDNYQTLGSPSFQTQEIVSGVPAAIDLEPLPDGRMLILGKLGDIKITDSQATNPVLEDYLTIPNVSSDFEWGLYSVALDPDFATNNYFYVYYSNNFDGNRFRISRFTHDGNHAHIEDEVIIWEANEDIVDQFHYGGGLDFGPDGMLYLATGDVFDDRQVAQDLTHSGGKLIRLDVTAVDALGGWVRGGLNDHLIPDDNPFVDGVGGQLDEIWAYGLRNPFRMDWVLTPNATGTGWDTAKSRLFIGEVGDNDQTSIDASFEDLHVADLSHAGANFGWPFCEGPKCIGPEPANYVPPLFSIQHTDSRAIISGTVYQGNALPTEYNNAYFFADFAKGWLRALTFDVDGNVSSDVPDGGFKLGENNQDLALSNPAALQVGADGAFYYVDIYAGALKRITFDGGNLAPVIDQAIATPSGPAAPLSIDFTSTATDSENDALTYLWDFGDGNQAGGANVTHNYGSKGAYTALLTVSDGVNNPVMQSVDVAVGAVPTAIINTPADGALFRAGDIINLTGAGSDSDGTITDHRWTVRFIHDDHLHPDAFENFAGENLSFEVESTGHDFSGMTGFEISLKVTDSDGLFDTEVISILPDKVDLNVSASNVPGDITFMLDALPRVGSFEHDTLVGFEHVITAPDVVNVAGVEYSFQRWISDNAPDVYDASLSIVAPETEQNYVADYAITNRSADAIDDAFVIVEDSSNNLLAVLSNDVDPDGDPLMITGVSSSSQSGVAAINSTNDGLIYTPSANFSGIETFTYTVSDGKGDIDQATVKVSIEGANDAPVAGNDSFAVVTDSTSNTLDVLGNDIDSDIYGGSLGSIDFSNYAVTEVSTVNPNRAVRVSSAIAGGALQEAQVVFDATPATGPDPHFHMMGMPAMMRPTYLTQHNTGGTGETVHFQMMRDDAQAFSFEGFSYTSGMFYTGANAAFTVTGSLAGGGEVSQTFDPAETERVFQAVTLNDAQWKNVIAVRFEGSLSTTGAVVTQELNIDNLRVTAASDVLTIASVGTTSSGGVATVNSEGTGIDYTPQLGFVGTETLSYTVTDTAGQTSTATVAITVEAASSLPVTTGIVLHLEADDGVTTDGTDLVIGWSDQSGLGNDLSGAGDPRLVTNGLNGQPVIAFDGAGDKLERIVGLSGLPTGSADRTIFMVAKYNSQGYGGFAYGRPDLNNAFGLAVDNNGRLMTQAWGNNNDNRTQVAGTGSGWLIQSVKLENDFLTHYKDGAQIDSGTHTYATTLDQLVLGAEIDSSPYLDMEVAAVLVYDGALSEAERQQVEDYLQVKYFSVDASNSDPTAVADNFSVASGTNSALSVLDNDTDVDGDTLVVTGVSAASNGGAVSISGEQIDYTPATGFVGTETFNYTVSDGEGGSDIGVVSVEVTGANNNLPDAGNDSYTVNEDSFNNEMTVLDNDTDLDGDGLSIVGISTPDQGGSVSFSAHSNDTLVYTPTADFAGSERFTYTVSDGNGGTRQATVTVMVANINDNPTAIGDSLTVEKSSSNNVLNVLANDTDTDVGDTLTIMSVGATDQNGSVSINAAGTGLDYTPALGFIGTESFTYTVEDSLGTTSTATVSVAIAELATLPVTTGLVLHLDANSGVTTDESDRVTGWTDQSNLGNDLIGAGDPRLVTGGLNGQSFIAFDGNGDKLERTIGLTGLPDGNDDRTIFMVARYNGQGNGGFTYGSASTNSAFGLVVNHKGDLAVQAWGFGNDNSSKVDGTNTGWLTQSVKLENGALNHYKDGVSIDSSSHIYNTTLDRLVLGAEIDSSPYLDMEVATVIVYDRALSEAERQQVESYIAQTYFGDNDAGGGNNSGSGNTAPAAMDDGRTTAEEVPVSIDVLNNDTDADGDSLMVTSFTQATNGTVTRDDNGTPNNLADDTLLYTPTADFAGTDLFTYVLDDGKGGTDIGTVTVTVTNTNDAPVAFNDMLSVSTSSNNNVLNVLANDTDPDTGDTLTITSVGATDQNGSVSINAAGTGLNYTPALGFVGTESFTYTVEDSLGAASTATVAVAVNEAAALPVTTGLVLHLDANSGVTIDGSDRVTGWTDQSNLGNNLTGAGNPRLVTDGLNGQAFIAFDGDGDKLERTIGLTGLPDGNDDRTIFMVARYNSVGNGGLTYGSASTNNAFGLVANHKGDLAVQAWGFGNDNTSKKDGTGTGWLTQSAKLESGVLNHYRDGVSIDSGSHTYNTTLDQLVLGAEIDSSPYIDMEVAEVLIFDRALSESERQMVENYLNFKYFA